MSPFDARIWLETLTLSLFHFKKTKILIVLGKKRLDILETLSRQSFLKQDRQELNCFKILEICRELSFFDGWVAIKVLRIT
ncbi:hypothetical protein ATZ36_10045 [Candidatus Endomicrobiellum trichonymphae]|uniref:Uncharacterized protein n=1 Tax=Endomicrobium trichonymphae TaxID=1408204 RepID=A0A1E5IFT5_ENDTX|nr:hypothetical protein ATZ36_10045 [Candidatus Endomicrobium trichonymphae]